MINVKAVIGNVLKPLIDDGTIGLYHYGNETELKRVYTVKGFNVNYPIVWLVMPFSRSQHQQNAKQWQGRLRLLLITSSTKDWLNDRRDITTFENTLRPLYDSITNLFEKNLQIIVSNNYYDAVELPNYYKEEQGTRTNPAKNNILDYKDVIQLEFDCLIRQRPDCNVKVEPEPSFVLVINDNVFTLGDNTTLTLTKNYL
jgi:hypothetical protein